MSLGVGAAATATATTATATAQMRAMAHPTRLSIMSLLTGAPMTAAEVARELGMTHANASYHLRQLHAAGKIAVAGEERIHGGVARRYRYLLGDDTLSRALIGPTETQAMHQALAGELLRRSAHRRPSSRTSHLTDADLWVDPTAWGEFRQTVASASRALHEAARPSRTPGTIRVSASIALFELEPDA
jgi:DNA-binding transcriptional ArsR family regulator